MKIVDGFFVSIAVGQYFDLQTIGGGVGGCGGGGRRL